MDIGNQSIPSYFIYINPNDLRYLRSDIWSDELVGAILKTDETNYKIKLSFRGSHIREFPKKSYYISFIKPRHPFYVKEGHLNAEYNDPSLIRNKLSLDFFSSIGVLSPESKHISLTINGKYQGVYLMLESVDQFFLRKRGLPEGTIYYAVDDNANFSLVSPFTKKLKKPLESGYERKIGSKSDDGALRELIFKINTIPEISFEKEIVKYVDVTKYLKWLAGVICTQNFDGFIHNYALYRNSETKLFEVIPWDYDATWGRDVNGDVMEYDYVPIQGYNTLTARILKNALLRKRYHGILKDILHQQFDLSFLKPKIDHFHDMLRPYVLRDPYKGGHIQEFDEEPELICEYILKRNQYLEEFLSELE